MTRSLGLTHVLLQSLPKLENFPANAADVVLVAVVLGELRRRCSQLALGTVFGGQKSGVERLK